MIQIPGPHEMEELWRNLFRFDNKMPLLVLRGSVSLGDFRVSGKRSVSKQLLLIRQIAAILKKLPDEQLWALLAAVKQNDCLDAKTSLGNCFLLVEEVVIDLLAKRLIRRGPAKQNDTAEAMHTILDLFGSLRVDYSSLCVVFSHPTMLVKACCGCDKVDEVSRARQVLSLV